MIDKPTIRELEALLNSVDERKVTINPDGSLTVFPTAETVLRDLRAWLADQIRLAEMPSLVPPAMTESERKLDALMEAK